MDITSSHTPLKLHLRHSHIHTSSTYGFTESFYTYIHRCTKVHMTVNSPQLPWWPFCNRNNSPDKFPPPYLLEHMCISFTDTAFWKKKNKLKFFSLTWSRSCCFCLLIFFFTDPLHSSDYPLSRLHLRPCCALGEHGIWWLGTSAKLFALFSHSVP